MFVAKGLSYVEIDQNGGTLSTLAGAGPFKLPIQWMVLTQNVSGSITIDHQANHKLLRLNMGNKSIASNSATTKPLTNNNSNSVNVELDGSGVITQHTYTSYNASTAFSVGNFTDLTGSAVPGTTSNSRIPYFDTDKNYGDATFGSSTISSSDQKELAGYNTSTTYDTKNGLFACIGGWSSDGSSGTNGSNKTATYTIPRTGRLHFIIVGGGGGGCDGVRSNPANGRNAGGGAGFSRGTINSVSAGATVSLQAGGTCRKDSQGTGPGGSAFDGTGGEQAQGGGHGGSSIINGAGINLTVLGGRGSPSNDTTVGTVDISAGPSQPSGVSNYDTNDTTETRCTSLRQGGKSLFTLDGGTDPTNRTTNHSVWRPSFKGWGCGGYSGAHNPSEIIGQNGGCPGIAVVWQDPYMGNPISGNYTKLGSFSGTLSPGGQYSGL